MNTSVTDVPRATPSGGGLPGLVAAEWTKLWSVRSTWWCLMGTLVLMALYTAGIGFDMSHPPDNAASMPRSQLMLDAGEAALGGVLLAQFAVIAMVMLAVTTEYSTGSIRSTLQWDPRRGHLIAAKTAVLVPVTLVGGALAAAIGAALADVTAREYGMFVVGDVASDVFRVGAYLAVVSVLTVGLSLLLRSAAGALTTIFMLLLLLPMVLGATGLEFMATVAEHLPGSAGLHFLGMAGVIGMTDLPYGRGTGLVILGAWAAVVLLLGYVVLRRRDA